MRRIVGELLAFAVFLLVCCWALPGCKFLGEASPRVERFECQVRAFKPLVDNVLDAEQLVKDLYAGKASMAAVLGNLQASAPELLKLQEDLQACDPPPPMPEGVVSSLQPDAGAAG
jgi:hypothetical protein